MKKLAVALVQQSCAPEVQTNIDKTAEKVKIAAAGGAQLVVLPELHTTRYFCQTENPDHFNLAETIPGPTTQQFSAMARDNAVVLVTSLFERRAPGLYHNTAVVFDTDGRSAGIYRKMHIPDDPGYYEKFYFAPGDLGFNPIATSVGNLGVLVCWDQWFPEAARMMALAGADLLIYPTAIGYDPADSPTEQQRQKDAWLTVQRGHAVANGIPVMAVNRVGFEAGPEATTGGIQFWGNSFVAGAQGEILGSGGEEEQLIQTVIDLERTETVRRIWPFFRDRRIDHYRELGERFRDR